ncbi:unnamed protein product, partial [Urochloa humidicola]
LSIPSLRSAPTSPQARLSFYGGSAAMTGGAGDEEGSALWFGAGLGLSAYGLERREMRGSRRLVREAPSL